MPVYKYKCKECDDILTTFQNMTDEPKTQCEQCDGELTRLIAKVNSRIAQDAFTIGNRMKSEARSISKKIDSGCEKTLEDIAGNE